MTERIGTGYNYKDIQLRKDIKKALQKFNDSISWPSAKGNVDKTIERLKKTELGDAFAVAVTQSDNITGKLYANMAIFLNLKLDNEGDFNLAITGLIGCLFQQNSPTR